MKLLALLVLVLPAAAAFAGPAGDDVLPKPYPASRYDKIAQHSPFSPPTGPAPIVTPPPSPKAPGWADTLSIAAAMQDGPNYLVTIIDSSANERFLASTDPAVKNSHDVTLTSVQWSDLPNETQATLRRGTEFATVRFDAASAPHSSGGGSSVPPAIPGGGGVPRPGASSPNRLFNPPPAINPAGGGPIRRNQLIRATPPPPPSAAPLPGPTLPRTVPPRTATPAGDDDDDD